MIRDSRISGMDYKEIAKSLELDQEQVFLAHLELINKKLLAWKPETIEVVSETEIDETTKEPLVTHELVAKWFTPIQPEKKPKRKWKINLKLNKNRGQTKEVASIETNS